MIRLYVIVEGRTEEIIANRLLVPHLSGLQGLRMKCPRFHRWIEKLEALGS
ncbi:MAG TPA: hypothetical protein VFK02_11075 [Kofleriaceae bacterium]|nr:hypothetical protein [Kofleriaceae bacterium]